VAGRDSLVFGTPANRGLARIVWADPGEADTSAGVQVLRRHGFEVRHVTSPGALRDLIDEDEVELILLEVVWPDDDGLSLCKDLAVEGGPPVIIYSASTNSVDCITGLEFGADDFVCKQAHPLELLARVRALLRRAGQPLLVCVGDLALDPRTHAVTRAGVELDLTPKEYAILEFLARHPDDVVSRQQLAEHVWHADLIAIDNLIDVHMKNLRRKVDPPGAVPLIRTVRGRGFHLSDGRANA